MLPAARPRTTAAVSSQPEAELSFVELGRRVLAIEATAVAALTTRIDHHFDRACHAMLACDGRIIVTGMGKSGHIGSKIAATLASTGSPAFYVHPGEASHGDLGMITAKDVVLALSNSGETAEIITILPLIKRLGIALIALTGNPRSTLAKTASAHIDVSVIEEACPLGLAPTASTTAALAMGDALAVALLQARGFDHNDFARSHPGGRLGRRLLLRVDDIMHRDQRVPRSRPHDSLKTALLEMTSKSLGMTVIVDDTGRLLGIFTDGDLRRALDRDIDLRTTSINTLMTSPCHSVTPEQLAVDAVRLMEAHKIFVLPVVDQESRLVGAFNMHDLLTAGVV